MTAMRGFPYRLRLRFREWQTAPDRDEQYSYHPTVEAARECLRLTVEDYGAELFSGTVTDERRPGSGALVTFSHDHGLEDHRL